MKTLNTLGLRSYNFIAFDASSDLVSDLSRGVKGSTLTNVDEMINLIKQNEWKSILVLAKTKISQSPYLITSKSNETQITDAIGVAEAEIADFPRVASSYRTKIIDTIYKEKSKLKGLARAYSKEDARIQGDEFISKNWTEINSNDLGNLRNIRAELATKIKDFLATQIVYESLVLYLENVKQLDSDIKVAIKDRNVNAMKDLLTKAKTKEQKDLLSSTIKKVEDEDKLLEEARKAIDRAETPEDKKKAQEYYDTLQGKVSGSVDIIQEQTGVPKGLIYVGIGLTVAIVGVLIVRGIRK
jgi:hypothetical protein